MSPHQALPRPSPWEGACGLARVLPQGGDGARAPCSVLPAPLSSQGIGTLLDPVGIPEKGVVCSLPPGATARTWSREVPARNLPLPKLDVGCEQTELVREEARLVVRGCKSVSHEYSKER